MSKEEAKELKEFVKECLAGTDKMTKKMASVYARGLEDAENMREQQGEDTPPWEGK